MENNTNIITNDSPNTSPENCHGGDGLPMETSPPPGQINDNNPTNTVFIERSSSSDTPPTDTGVCSHATTSCHMTADALLDIGASLEQVRGGSDAEQGRKRERGDEGDGGEQQQIMKAAKRKGELTEVPKGEPKCATCNKVFKSWKALFGHLRSHPERTYRGALPPPTAAELDIRRCEEQLASTLLTVAQQVEVTRRGLDIDLNQPSLPDDDDGSPEKRGGVGFDLNADPPPESDSEE